MQEHTTFRKIIFFNLFLALPLLVSTSTKASTEGLELIAIVNPQVELAEVDYQTLRDIYTGQSEHWPDGQRIFPVLRPVVKESAYRFYRDVLYCYADCMIQYGLCANDCCTECNECVATPAPTPDFDD